MEYLIGCDIGTSGTKTVLFDRSGTILAACSAEYSLYQPEIGWAEQNPEDWWEAVAKTIRGVLEKSGVKNREIAGVGLSGQMHGLVMLDAHGKVIRKSIIWCDQRTSAECAEITSLVGEKRLLEITANPALTGFTASKIRWVQKHEPEVYARCAHILLPKDYIRFRLTGTFATEVSDASGMQLLDVPNRRWSDEVLDKLGIRRNLLGDVYESADATGGVTAEAAAETGLAAGTVVAGGAGDQAAAAVGNGIVEQGLVSCNVGTSGVVFAHMDAPNVDPGGRVHTFCHAVPGAWHVMGVTQGAGLSMKWFKDQFYREESREFPEVYDEINRQISSCPVGAEGVIYLPYLMGERTPHLDPNARGVFFGLSARHEKRHLARAVMEGVSYSLLDCLEIIRQMGVRPGKIRMGGGGAKSPVWRQMLTDLFAVDGAVTNSGEAGALGAAILAGVAGGVYEGVVSACRSMIHETAEYRPQPENTEKYLKYYGIYRGLYPALKESYQALAAL